MTSISILTLRDNNKQMKIYETREDLKKEMIITKRKRQSFKEGHKSKKISKVSKKKKKKTRTVIVLIYSDKVRMYLVISKAFPSYWCHLDIPY